MQLHIRSTKSNVLKPLHTDRDVPRQSKGTSSFEDNRLGTHQLKELRKGFGRTTRSGAVMQLRERMQEGTGNTSSPIQTKTKTNKTGLPDQLKSGVENLSGFAMDDVKVHFNSSKPAQLQAHAYAQGTDIHLAPGQEKHLPHEAWHVVQQKQGRVKPTHQLKSKVSINDDAGLEREADVMGAKALQFKGEAGTGVAQRKESSPRESGGGEGTVQMKWGFGCFICGGNTDNVVEPEDVQRNVPQAARQAAPGHGRAVDAAIENIQNAGLDRGFAQIIQNSRAKTIYLFDAQGVKTQDKAAAIYMVDTSMDRDEQRNYERVRGWGVGAPEIFGQVQGHPIVQYIASHLTVGGGGGRPLVPSVKQGMFLDKINGKPFDLARWSKLLDEVKGLIEIGYTSADLQFMVDDTGEIFIMDLEGNNEPKKDAGEDPKLVELKEFLEAKIEEQL